jgi:hypothetical protein
MNENTKKSIDKYNDKKSKRNSLKKNYFVANKERPI